MTLILLTNIIIMKDYLLFVSDNVKARQTRFAYGMHLSRAYLITIV